MKASLTILIGMAVSLAAFAAEPSPASHFYTVEYTHRKAAPPIVDVVFFQDITPEKALEYLKIQLATAVRFNGPTTDVMAFAWRRRGKSELDEDQITLPDGSAYLIYRKGQYLSEKQVPKQPARPK